MPVRQFFIIIFLFLISSFILGCQSNNQKSQEIAKEPPSLTDTKNEIGLSEDHGRLDLSLATLEQQNKDKEEAAKKLEEARKQRIVIETEIPTIKIQGVNIASFARTTSNKKGQSIYARSPFHTFNHLTECSIFNTDDSAQRYFLKKGGPGLDPKNLDPDGDGFACNWDPVIYRQLNIPNQ